MIKVDLITGFLGSGKTTFLLQYARYLMDQGMRIGILEYDHGAVNVDMLLLHELRGEKCELEMVAAGCDVDCLNRRFRTKLISMAMSGYDRVIIEPSGVFDMDMFFDVLRDEPLDNWYEIGSVITIVNANLRDDLSQEEDFFLASQMASAGCVVLSRTQLSDAERIENTKQHVRRALEDIQCKNVEAHFLEKDFSQFNEDDYQRLVNCGYQLNSYVKQIAGKRLDISSVCFLEVKDDLDKVKRTIQTLFASDAYGSVIRVKGFILDGEKSYQINASQYEVMIEEVKTDKSALIVIGTELDEGHIRQLIQAEHQC